MIKSVATTISFRLCSLLVIMLFTCPSNAYALPRLNTASLILLLVDNLTLTDITGGLLPHIKTFFDGGACALVNNNVATGSNLASSYLTLGTGTRSRATEGQPGYMPWGVFSDEDSLALEVLQRRVNTTTQGEVLQPEIISMVGANQNLGYLVDVGALGATLQNAGYNTAVIGCADTNTKERPLVNMFMNREGSVPYGNLGPGLLVREPSGPFGYWTSSHAVLAAARHYKQKAHVIAIEWSDLYRVDKYTHYCQPSIAVKMREQALRQLDEFAALLLAEFPSGENGTSIAIISPSARLHGIDSGQRLTPIAVCGFNIDGGHLISNTTRRSGLVANIDLPASILVYFNLSIPDTMVGHPISIVPTKNAVESLVELAEQTHCNYYQRPFVIRLFIGYLIVTLGLAIIATLSRQVRLKSLVQYSLLGGVMVPLALLLLPLLPPTSILVTVLIVVAASLLPPITAYLLDDKRKVFWALAATTVFVLALDVARGQYLVGSSILGYCYITGARYYGLGNEYMGIFIGASLTLLGLSLEFLRLDSRCSRLIIGITAILGSYFIGASQLGANAGGTLAFALGSWVTFLGFKKNRLSWCEVRGAFLITVIIVALLPLSELYFAKTNSHIGHAFWLLRQQRLPALMGIVQRKVGMNLKLLRYSLWSRVLMMLFLTLGTVFLGPYQHKFQWQRSQPALTASIKGSIVAAVAALIANDSGVVAGATTLLFPVALLLINFLSTKDQSEVRLSNC
ncbi:MAG TPA: hypothetical protein VJ036_07535 [bacterium]|nr:hypothetical protein [bacterium]